MGRHHHRQPLPCGGHYCQYFFYYHEFLQYLCQHARCLNARCFDLLRKSRLQRWVYSQNDCHGVRRSKYYAFWRIHGHNEYSFQYQFQRVLFSCFLELRGYSYGVRLCDLLAPLSSFIIINLVLYIIAHYG